MSDDEGDNYDIDDVDNYEDEEPNYEVDIDIWDPSALPENPNDVYNDDEDFKGAEDVEEDIEIDDEEDDEEEVLYEIDISEDINTTLNIIHRGDDRITDAILTKFEKARAVGILASMLEDINFNIDQRLYDYTDSDDVLTMAEVWIKNSKIIKVPLVLKKLLPNGEEDWWLFEELLLPEELYTYSGGYPL